MELANLINRLRNLLKREIEILSEFPIDNLREFTKIQEEKKQILLNISQYSEKDVKLFQNQMKEIYNLNSIVSALLTNQIAFFEELEKELFEESSTYGKPKKTGNFFKGKI